jgi:hypothetical protein
MPRPARRPRSRRLAPWAGAVCAALAFAACDVPLDQEPLGGWRTVGTVADGFVRQDEAAAIPAGLAGRGGRRMVSGSVGSKASAIASPTDLTMLSHRICSGVIGRV